MLERALLGLIRFYQAAISPLTPAACRFRPSCSEYARRAVEQHGAGRGGWLALKRIARCHPLASAGYDPVPPAPEAGERRDATRDRTRAAQDRKRRDGQ